MYVLQSLASCCLSCSQCAVFLLFHFYVCCRVWPVAVWAVHNVQWFRHQRQSKILLCNAHKHLKWKGKIWLTITHYRSLEVGKCRGRTVKSTKFKLWCFWSSQCGFESPVVNARHLTIASSLPMGSKDVVSHVLCNACKRTQCTYRKEKRFSPVFLAVAAICAIASRKPL